MWQSCHRLLTGVGESVLRVTGLMLVGLLLVLMSIPLPALAEKRIALLIGNQAYATDVGPLKNPLNDIHLVGAALAKVGFEVMAPVQDANRGRILYAAHDFAGRLQAAGPEAIGFFYYSGHGVALDGDNFLIPINVKSTARRELDVEGIKLSDIINILNDRAPRAVHFIVFDACRNNLGGARGAKGFIPIDACMLIAFSTAPGTTASDQGDNSGPYAQALAIQLVRPGNHSDLFFEVRKRVADITAQEQIPWTMDGLMRRVHFGGLAVGPPPQPMSPGPLYTPSPPPQPPLAKPVPAPTAPQPAKPRSDASIECSRRADSLSLHGKERYDFRAKCFQEFREKSQ
jgi:uncharacterized caspase-like protein